MLIAVSIFAVTVVVTAGIFGSSSNMQVSTKASINNVEFSQQINNNIFNDLKSATGWYKIEAMAGGLSGGSSASSDIYQVKGFAIFSYQSSSGTPAIQSSFDPSGGGNLVIGAKDNSIGEDYIIYYFETATKKLYGRTIAGSPCKMLKSDTSDCGVNKIIPESMSDKYLLKNTGSVIDSLSFNGTNYLAILGRPVVNPQHPFLETDLKVKAEGLLGGGSSSVLETKNAISSRNFQERPQ